jgi:hypothetical protein
MRALWLLSLFLSTVLPAQGTLQLDDRALAEPRAQLDPLGALELRGDADGERIAFVLRFPELRFPAVGVAELDTELRAYRADGENPAQLASGELEVVAFMAERVAGRLRWEGHELRFDLVPTLGPRDAPAVVGCPPLPAAPAANDTPAKEDLVFCAVGGTGTGLPGARRVIDSIARLAPSGPLDHVLLLGNNLAPTGVASIKDPLWQERFEDAWPRKTLPIAFYAAPGDWDNRGNVGALVDYGIMNDRWTMPSTWSYRFAAESHGKTFDFISFDTGAMTGSLGIGGNRHAIRMADWLMRQSTADWKIVFGNLALRSAAADPDEKLLAEFEHRIAARLLETKIDVYLSGADHFLELRKPEGPTLHVVSGAGGGPEVAQPMRCDGTTLFAHTGGGFAWFRFDGRQLEISLRDADGKALCVHRLTK